MPIQKKLLIGLGNPGDRYNWTRHNIGFEIIDALAVLAGIELKKEKQFSALIGSGKITINYKKHQKVKVPLTLENQPETESLSGSPNKIIYQKKTISQDFSQEVEIILVKPQTFMNQSGTAVQAIKNFFKIASEDILVIHDDVALDTAKLRMAFNRGAGGQHGVEDIIQKLGGDKNFHRLKFGVGPDPGGDLRGDYVLKRFPPEQLDSVKLAVNQSLRLIQSWLLCEDPQQIEII
jgi:PTH1 family peptidyl-tRNA hydrolase